MRTHAIGEGEAIPTSGAVRSEEVGPSGHSISETMSGPLCPPGAAAAPWIVRGSRSRRRAGQVRRGSPGRARRSQVFDVLERGWDESHSTQEVSLRWMGTPAEESTTMGPLLPLRRRIDGDPDVDHALTRATSAGETALAVRRWLQRQ